MNKSKKVIKPNVVGGGVAIPLGNNFYFMRGRKHEQGGIDVGPNNENGLEVEDGEVMQMGGKHVKVYSSLPILNGKSPAQLIMAGLDPNKVFNAQERFKDINKLNDDGSRKARFGKRQKAEFGSRDEAIPFINDTNKNFISDKPVDSFLGSDYVHNFIQDHKEAMGVDVDSFNTPAYKIDDAYLKQSLTGGTKVNGITKHYMYNKVTGNDTKSYSNFKSSFENTPNYFPNRTNKTIIENIQDGDNVQNIDTFEGYLPSLGHFKTINGQVVKRLGGSNRHFTINGNVVNKAGYVPSTGELPKANLGTVASIDKHAIREDKYGYISNALRSDVQKQIDTYNASKEYRKSKSAEIKRKRLETSTEIEENKIKKRKTLFDREKEISRNPNTNDKIETNIVKKETNNKIEKIKNKNKTNINTLNINSLYPNRFGNLTDPTIKLEGNDVPLSALPQLAVEAINRKLMFNIKKDVDPESKGLNKEIEYINGIPQLSLVKGNPDEFKAVIDPHEVLESAIGYAINGKFYTDEEIDNNPYIKESINHYRERGGKIIGADNISLAINNTKPKYPDIITGDTIMYNGLSNMNGRRYYLPQSINLRAVKGGYRNRGDYRDIETQGLVLPTMHEFYRFGDLNQETIKLLQSNDPNNLKGLIGVDKEGNIKVGRFGDFNEDDVVSVVSYDNIRGFNKNNDGTIKWAPRSDKWSDKYVFTETTSINPITGKDETGSVNVGGSRANPTDKAYGFLNGGHVVIKAGDEVRLISGSVSDIDKEIEKMKIRNNVDNVEFFMLDNGTYNLGLRTTDGVLKASDLKRYDNQNTGGGHGIYLKRLGGMSKRQKAEGGKDIFSPRGLGIQASMTKMQADAWDKKHPGEYNPFAQQFIDEFGDPTIYSSIMSDDANARRFGIDRGYKGNRGLGWVIPELPNINLDNYFNAQGNYITRADGGSSIRSGSGVSDIRRPEINSEPLEPLTIKPPTQLTIKPPTQLTIKPPETETKNKGTWWRDNGSDLISGLAKGGASLASYLINRNMLNDLKYSGQPIFTPAAKLKTKININPQIDAVNRTIAARNRVAEESASSKVRNSRMNANYIDRLSYLNELYGNKENKETELINADKLNQQEVAKDNIKTYNDWVEKKQNFENTVREKQSENAVSFVSNLASGVDDILANRQKRKQFKQNVAAYIASHPNVSPELLESYGLDIFDHKTNKSDKSEIKISKSKGYRNTGMTEEEYGKWLKETDFDKYIVWNSARTEKQRNAKIRAAKREKGKI